MTDEELGRELRRLGMDEASYRALPLLPLVQVAWADGIIQDAERDLILELAESRYRIGEEGQRVLRNWLHHPPSAGYAHRGRRVLLEMGGRAGFDGVTRHDLADVVAFAKKVAMAAGGSFGFGAISASEADAIDEIAQALDITGARPWATADDDTHIPEDADRENEGPSIEVVFQGPHPATQAAKSPIGVLILEQDASSLAATTNNALSALVLYSFFGLLVALLIIGIYSSWLSLRIRKLSTAASQAISEAGQVNDQFPIFSSKDEIGDLSRSYAQLLSRLKEYTNYLRTLSSKLSHELRTPLAIVRSSLDNLEHESLSQSARTYAERAKEGTTRLSNILNSMSAASRVEQSIRSAELESIPCDELLSNLRDAYRDIFPHIAIKLKVQPDRRKFRLQAAGDLLVQMMDKLVDNAADFCPRDGLVELGLYRTDRHIVITVRNEGPPLPSHMQNQLFDSMVTMRDKESPSNNNHHLGLGLYIVRLIVDFHHGEVQGYNVPDMSGVIFEIKLPAE